MICRYKIHDQETNEVLIAVGDNSQFFESMGYTEVGEVEQAYDGRYFLAGYAPSKPLETMKAEKLDALNAAHEQAEADAHVLSSLGFTVDADDRANRDVDGLLKTLKDGETVSFCDFNNDFHELNRAQCETLQIEIIQNAQALYAQKWQYRTQVEAAESVEELEALEFTFSHLSF